MRRSEVNVDPVPPPASPSALHEAERVLSLGIIAIRTGVLAQVISGTVRGLDSSSVPSLYLVLSATVTIESVVLMGVVWRARRPVLRPWGILDLILGFVMLAALPFALPGSSMSDTWIWWASSLAINVVGNFGATSLSVWWIGGASVGMSAAYVTVATTYAAAPLMKSFTEALNYPIFGFGLLFVSGYLRRMASRADADRQDAVEAMRQSEANRARLLVHDASGLLRMLGDPSTPPAILPALRRQARQESAQIRAFLAEHTESPILRAESLGEILRGVAEGFTDLPLEFAIDLGADAIVPREHAPAVGRAVKTVFHNVRRHAEASQVIVHADEIDDRWEVIIRDDGVGFDASANSHGFGLASQVIGELTRLGLSVEVASARGRGTTVIMSGPCDMGRI